MVNFVHFKSGENEKFLFLQLPLLLIKDDMFKKLSSDAKILYSLLLSRTSLSAKNGWVDENDNIYIIYTIEQIMTDLNCWEQKAIKAMKELKEIGLIKSMRQGLGKPNIIYVMNFSSVENPCNTLNCENHNSRIAKITIQEPPKITIQELRKSQGSNIDINKINNSKIESSQSQSQTDADENKKSDMTMTLTSDVSASNDLENKRAFADLPMIQHGQAEAPTNNQNDYNILERLIKENIDYVNIVQGHNREFIDSLVQIMIDVILTESPKTIKIGKEIKSREIVKSIYMKLNSEHIEHIIAQYKDQHHRITHKTAYLRTCLYTAFQEIEPHVTNAVRADGLVW